MINIDNSSPFRCSVLTYQLYKDGQPNADLITQLAVDELLGEFNCFGTKGNPSVDMAKMQYGFPHSPDPALGYLEPSDIAMLLEKERSFRLQKKVSREMIELADQVGKKSWSEITAKLAVLNPTNAKTVIPSITAKQAYEERRGRPTGPLTGIKILDDVIQGLEPGTLTTNFAYVSQYKTLTLTNIAYSAAKLGYNGCFNTLEVPREFMRYAFIARHSLDPKFRGKGEPIDTRALRKQTLTPAQEEFAFGVVEPDFDALPGKVVILEAGELADYTAVEFDRWCRAAGMDIDFYALDYIQLLMIGKDPYETGNFYVDEAKSIALGRSSTKKRIALMAAQANRDGYARAVENDGRYDLRAVAELNRIERSSDNVFCTYANEATRAARECKLQLLKHRGGELIETPMSVKVDPRFSCIGSSDESVAPVGQGDLGLLSGVLGLGSSVGF